LDEPPAVGLVTTTGITSGRASRYVGIVTTIRVGVTRTGNRTAFPKLTTVPVWKLDPLIVNVTADDPAGTELGDSEVITGVSGCAYSLTTNESG
jgi:hypothetical protein